MYACCDNKHGQKYYSCSVKCFDLFQEFLSITGQFIAIDEEREKSLDVKKLPPRSVKKTAPRVPAEKGQGECEQPKSGSLGTRKIINLQKKD